MAIPDRGSTFSSHLIATATFVAGFGGIEFSLKLYLVRKTIAATVLLLCALTAFAQVHRPPLGEQSPWRVKVVDELGAVIPKALVLLHADALERNNPKPFDLELHTGSEGEAKGVLPSGFYDVFVASTGFSPHCEKLRVRDRKPVALRFVLRVDKLMSDEYGDRVEQP